MYELREKSTNEREKNNKKTQHLIINQCVCVLCIMYVPLSWTCVIQTDNKTAARWFPSICTDTVICLRAALCTQCQSNEIPWHFQRAHETSIRSPIHHNRLSKQQVYTMITKWNDTTCHQLVGISRPKSCARYVSCPLCHVYPWYIFFFWHKQ